MRLLLFTLTAAFAFAQNPETAVFNPSTGTAATDADLLVAKDRCTSATLTSSINASTLTIPVSSVACFVAPTYATIDDIGAREVVHVCSVGVSSLTVCASGRGVNGTVATTHTSGKSVKLLPNDAFHNKLAAEVKAVETWALTVGTGGGGGGSAARFQASISGTSTTILATTHHLGTNVVVDGCRDASGVSIEVSRVAINGSGDVTITTATNQTGTCTIWGTTLYAASISGTSTTVLGTTHGLGTTVTLAGCIASGVMFEVSRFSVNGSGDATITTATSQTGTCYLR